MEQKEEKKIKNKRLSILLLQCAIVIGCIVIFYIAMTPKDRVKDTTYSYSKLEEVKEYEVEGNYITRVRPLTEYEIFKETAEYTLKIKYGRTYDVKVYLDPNKTQEVTDGYIKSGMVLEGIPNIDNPTNQIVTYTIGVIGDFTKDGDISIAELTKIIKGVVGLSDWIFTEEEKLIADFNGDKEVNVVDIEECINYIVYGRLTLENGTKLKATDEYGITWNYTYQNGKATDVYYESGELSAIVNIPASLDGHPVVKLYNSNEERSIFANAEEDYNNLKERVLDNRNLKNPSSESNLEIRTINIPNSVTSIGKNAFEFSTSVTKIVLPDSLKIIDNYAFSGCTSLTSINVPDSVTGIGKYAFAICNKLETIKLSNQLKSISEYTFYSNMNLTNVNIPNSVSTIEQYAFIECKSMDKIEIPNSVTSIEMYAFSNCINLAEIKISDSVVSVGNGAFFDTAWENSQPDGLVYAGRVAYDYKGTMPENTSIELEEGTISISPFAFSWNQNLVQIKIPYGVTSIGDRAFRGCTSLENIEIPDSVVSVGYDAFNETVWYNNQPDGLVYAGKVAYKYKGTMPENTVITLEEGTISISPNAFEHYITLSRITIPDSVVLIGNYAFNDCSNLESVEIPDSITNIGAGAFSSCKSLTDIDIPEGVTYIADSTFRNCTNLTDVKIPEGVKKIESNAFNSCTNLTSINIPSSLMSIEEFAFEYCRKLENIVIWKNVNEIGNRTFYQWTDSQTINIEANEVPEGWDRDWDYGCNAKIVYGYTGN